MVQIGEKDQGCKMINGVEKQYPKKLTNQLSKKPNMSLKNLNAIKTPKNLLSKLSNKKLRFIQIFEKNFDIKEDFAVAVSGGPDSLALAF